MVSVRRGFFFLLVLGKTALFYFGHPWAFDTTQRTYFGYLLDLLRVLILAGPRASVGIPQNRFKPPVVIPFNVIQV